MMTGHYYQLAYFGINTAPAAAILVSVYGRHCPQTKPVSIASVALMPMFVHSSVYGFRETGLRTESVRTVQEERVFAYVDGGTAFVGYDIGLRLY